MLRIWRAAALKPEKKNARLVAETVGFVSKIPASTAAGLNLLSKFPASTVARPNSVLKIAASTAATGVFGRIFAASLAAARNSYSKIDAPAAAESKVRTKEGAA